MSVFVTLDLLKPETMEGMFPNVPNATILYQQVIVSLSMQS